jgi:hypothetical protein
MIHRCAEQDGWRRVWSTAFGIEKEARFKGAKLNTEKFAKGLRT